MDVTGCSPVDNCTAVCRPLDRRNALKLIHSEGSAFFHAGILAVVLAIGAISS